LLGIGEASFPIGDYLLPTNRHIVNTIITSVVFTYITNMFLLKYFFYICPLNLLPFMSREATFHFLCF
jgi:hypothetical protein